MTAARKIIENLKLSVTDIKKIEFINCDNSKNKLSREGEIVKFTEPILLATGIRLCPLYPELCVSETGSIFYSSNLSPINYKLGNRKYYPKIRVRNINGRIFRVFVHRVIASAWVAYGDVFTQFYVNHKDGIKNNPDKDNLEWVSSKENIRHAYDNELNDCSRPFKHFDILTGEVVHHKSIASATEYFGVKSSALFYYFLGQNGKSLYKKRYEFKYKSDETQWKSTVSPRLKPISKWTIYVTTPSGEEQIYWKLSEFDIEYNGYNCTRSIDIVIDKARKRHPNLKFRYESRTPVFIFQVKDLETNEVFKIEGLHGVSKYSDLSFTSLKKLQENKIASRTGKYLIRKYRGLEPWTEKLFKPRKVKAIRVTNTLTGLTITLPNLREVSRSLGVSVPTIAVRLETGDPWKSFQFEHLIE